jgi:hypothetical protein
MDEFSDDDDDSQIFDDFQEEYPFEINMPDDLNENNGTIDDEQSTIEDSEASSVDIESAKVLEEFDVETFSKVKKKKKKKIYQVHHFFFPDSFN